MKNNDLKQEELIKIISFLKQKGFVFPSSDIYGGLANSWDYGPLGSLLKDNIKKVWKREFIDKIDNSFHFDSSIILSTEVWKHSGHLKLFSDPVVECKNDNTRYRVSDLLEKYTDLNADLMSFETLKEEFSKLKDLKECENSNWSEVKDFNLMFQLNNGASNKDDLYLRPETAQGVFINFKNIMDSMNLKLPFSIGQIGKSFRNEVTPKNFIFKTKEFEQLELEHFTKPEQEDKDFDKYEKIIDNFLMNILKFDSKDIEILKVPKDDLAHYSKKTFDYLFDFPFGKKELLGLANRGNYDLTIHGQIYNFQAEKIIPSVIETSIGVERIFLAIICKHLNLNEIIEGGEREILKLPFELAPYKLAVAPLTSKLESDARDLYNNLLELDLGPIIFTKAGSIGKRYRKQDAIGTPFVITVDFDTLDDKMVTIRNRDSMEQKRVLISDIQKEIKKY